MKTCSDLSFKHSDGEYTASLNITDKVTMHFKREDNDPTAEIWITEKIGDQELPKSMPHFGMKCIVKANEVASIDYAMKLIQEDLI